MARIEQLEKLASSMVGDGKSPNIFFVGLRGNIIMVTTEFEDAYKKWQSISNQRKDQTALEDRKNGVLASVEPEDDTPGARLIRIDDSDFVRKGR